LRFNALRNDCVNDKMTLRKAVEFVKPASNDELASHAYLRIGGGYVTASDGTISAGYPIDEDLAVCPHADKLASALKRVGDRYSVTALDSGRLSVKGAKLRAVVPCVAAETLPSVAPDPNIAPIGEPLRQAFKTLVPLVKEDGQRLIEYSFLINNGSMSATNGNVILQYWHGTDLPPNLIIPRKFGLLASKVEGLVGFGFSDKSVTFWYENAAWLRTSLCVGEWPDIDKLLTIEATAKPLPTDFFEAIQSVADFSDDGAIRLSPGKVKSSYVEQGGDGPVTGASFDCEGLDAKATFNIKLLSLLNGVATSMDFATHEDRAVFYGENVRGVIAKRNF